MPEYIVTVTLHIATPADVPVQTVYLLAGSELEQSAVARLSAELLYDPVIQQADITSLTAVALNSLPADNLPDSTHILEIAYRPGVTDNAAESLLHAARRLGLSALQQVRTLQRYLLPPDYDSYAAAHELANDLVQTTLLYQTGHAAEQRYALYQQLLLPPAPVSPQIAHIALQAASDAELLQISRTGVLALDLAEMHAIRDYFAGLGRDPTDGELETIAQTWSEHCSHKSFKAHIRYQNRTAMPDCDAELYPAHQMLQQDCAIDSLIRTFLMEATSQILARHQASPDAPAWVLSAFVDNAGIIAFTDAYELSFKVETHNHPSALEPFGGANTGVGGVIRDVLGVSARPIANTDVLCFGWPDLPTAELSPGVLHPRRICNGVVAGVRDYGNKLGIPTVNGAVLFDPGYTANPLVYCGTLGIAPRGSHPRNVQPGDIVVVFGGRTGRDGIHGATFSSAELTHTTGSEVGSAVQIGDPITEKKVLDVLLQARDQGLYSAITDCGAGGLSSAVGEMGAETGVAVELEHVPLKYAGLQPWEIWLSEAQERMVLAVPPQQLQAFLDLCAAEDVEATPIGHFTGDQRLQVTYAGQPLVDLAMNFLHDGRPQRRLAAIWQPDVAMLPGATSSVTADPLVLLKALLSHPNIASKEQIIRTYDHEVGGSTVIKPLVGASCDGPGDAAVLQPLRTTGQGVALGCGINPRYGALDPYWMALACVDEALRNIVAVGGDPRQTVILDNFCWGDPRKPDRLAGLVRAAAGCYDAALAFGTPFISGKDSLNNEYRDADGCQLAIPPTLLISALAHVPNVRMAVTMDLKEPGNRVYLVGATRAELGGAHVLDAGLDAGDLQAFQMAVPRVDLAVSRRTFLALHTAMRSGLVRACHDLSEGGLAVAAAEMAFAGACGLILDIARMGNDLSATIKLFAESPGRFLVEVRPGDTSAFETALADVPLTPIGQVMKTSRLHITDGDTALISVDSMELKAAWRGGLGELITKEKGERRK